MRTLFSENILSPAPTPVPQQNPFELLFPSTLSNASSSASVQSSPNQHEWLTQHWQNQQRAENDATNYGSTGSSAPLTRRKGNPKLLFMGLRKSGKSSVQKVVFQKMSPADTLFLEPTTRIEKASLQSFVTIDTAELPTSLLASPPELDHHAVFSNMGAVIWILDVQDDYLTSIASLIETTVFLAEHYPRINIDVFIHKIDGLSEEYKYDTFREVRQRVQDELSDVGHADKSVSYYQTSIFDHSIFEAMSKVVQKLLPQLPAMETLLNKLCSTCRIQKAYLFDTSSKIYVATDASPTFLRDYEVCSDYVDVVVDIKQIYGWQQRDKAQAVEDGGEIGESMVTYDHSGDTYIYAREINDHLSLLCVMGKGSSADKRVLIDYNVSILQTALVKVFRV
ncbi:GTP-binding protein gtr2 [Elasticomyces elasticus]|nr:GTP-binding protein gtr2 [Elasticomyces elasticus]